MDLMTCEILNITEKWTHICSYGLNSTYLRGSCLVRFHYMFWIFWLFWVDFRNVMCLTTEQEQQAAHQISDTLLHGLCVTFIDSILKLVEFLWSQMSSACNTAEAAGLAEAEWSQEQQKPYSLMHADAGLMNPTLNLFKEMPSLQV